DLFQFLPLAIQPEERTNFKVSGGNVEGTRDLGPVLQIAKDLPVLIAVIDYENVSALPTHFLSHRVGSRAFLLKERSLPQYRPKSMRVRASATSQVLSGDDSRSALCLDL